MREIDKYGVFKEKLQGVCDDNGLLYSIRNNGYPFILTIKPVGGMDSQQTMMEGMEENDNTGYINPDASLVFAYKDGDLTYKISETFTISDKLFSKLKNLFKNLHAMWMQHFFRDWVGTQSRRDVPAQVEQEPAAPLYDPPTEEDADEFADFFGDEEEE